MPGKLDCYNLGSMGVNVDKNPLELEDGELSKSQNGIHDPMGSMGGLRSRPGLTKLNSVAAAGAINGAIGVPLIVGTAGNDGGVTPSPVVSPTTRKFFMGRRASSTVGGWNTSTDTFATAVTTGGPDGYDANATPRVPDNLWTGCVESGDTTVHKYRAYSSGRPSCMYKNRMFYAGNDYTFQGSTALTASQPTIRMFDGTTDYLICRIPPGGNTSNVIVSCEAIIEMIVGGDNNIYFTTHDNGLNSSNTMVRRIWQLNPENHQLLQLGTPFGDITGTSGVQKNPRVPWSLCWHAGRLFTRTMGAGVSAGSHLMFYFRPGIDTTWTSETSIDADGHACNTLCSFQGQLFQGLVQDGSVAGADIRVRSPFAVYSVSKLALLDEGGGSPAMTSFGYANHYGAMAVFGNALYVSYFNQEGLVGNNTGDKYVRVYKYDGTSWTLVYSPAKNTTTAVPFSNAIVLGGKLFFISAPCRTSANPVNQLLYTADGITFTSVTTAVLTNDSSAILGAITS